MCLFLLCLLLDGKNFYFDRGKYCFKLKSNGNRSIILRLEGIKTRMKKMISVKDYSYRERLKKLELTTLQDKE